MRNEDVRPDADAPVLVAVCTSPGELDRARHEGWYRIPLLRSPRRVAAEYLALYQTGAFPAGERWQVRWVASIRSYGVAQRRELLPEEPDHPHALEQYYRLDLGPFAPLPSPIPSRRLRRITFINTTWERLERAREINDLWLKSSAQERLWEALKTAGLADERQYPLRDETPEQVADFAFLCSRGKVALVVSDEPQTEARIGEEGTRDYLAASEGWVLMRVTSTELLAEAEEWAARVALAAAQLGGLAQASDEA